MTEAYYDPSVDGLGFEGVMNYVNTAVNGWLANLFLIFIFVVTILVLMKSEWKMSGIFAYAFFLVFISSLIMSLFLQINGYIIFVSIIGMGLSVLTGILTKNKG